MTPVTTRSYTVTVSDANGCSNTAGKTVTVNTAPTVSANASANAVCTGNSVILTGSGAQTYQWTNAVTNGIAYTPDITRPYYVTGTDSHGCTGTASITVTVNPLPIAGAIASSNPVCAGNSVTLTGSNAQFYSWSNGISNGQAFVPSTTSTYTVTATDANGCTNTSSITVTVAPLPSANAGSSTTICSGTVVNLGGNPTAASGTPPYTYLWDPSVHIASTLANPDTKPTSTTSYSVNVSDSHGCSATSNVTVTVNASPVVSIVVNPAVTISPGGIMPPLFRTGS
ncbi:MAG: hypothetical protein IT235_07280 [Bacteroidia bacterium]|nr:hypothetical protein [Bacteroidia bacterium]